MSVLAAKSLQYLYQPLSDLGADLGAADCEGMAEALRVKCMENGAQRAVIETVRVNHQLADLVGRLACRDQRSDAFGMAATEVIVRERQRALTECREELGFWDNLVRPGHVLQLHDAVEALAALEFLVCAVSRIERELLRGKIHIESDRLLGKYALFRHLGSL